MTVLVAAVVVVGIVGIVNLVFSFGIIRRLREHSEILSKPHGNHSAPVLAAGSTAGDFAATTEDGTSVTRASLTGPTLIGFFSPGCGPCEDALPKFVATAQAHPGGREHVIAVVSAPPDQLQEATNALVTRLLEVAEVVREQPSEGLQAAFEVSGFPAFAMVDTGGVVLSNDLAATPAPA